MQDGRVSAAIQRAAKNPSYTPVKQVDVLQAGDHVVQTGAFGLKDLLHHALYIGNGKIVHYYGDPYIHQSVFGKDRSSVRLDELDILHMLNDGDSGDESSADPTSTELYVQQHPNAIYRGQTAVDRALQRLGECEYNALTNNCEHFVYWALYGVPYSNQTEMLAF